MKEMHETFSSCREEQIRVDIYNDPVCIVEVRVITTKILIQDGSLGLRPTLIITNNAIMIDRIEAWKFCVIC